MSYYVIITSIHWELFDWALYHVLSTIGASTLLPVLPVLLIHHHLWQVGCVCSWEQSFWVTTTQGWNQRPELRSTGDPLTYLCAQPHHPSPQSTLAALIHCLHKTLGSNDSHETMDHPTSLHAPTTFHRWPKAVFTGAKYLKYIINGVICVMGAPARAWACPCEFVGWGGGGAEGGWGGRIWRRERAADKDVHSWLRPRTNSAVAIFKGHLCLSSKPRGHRLGQKGET